MEVRTKKTINNWLLRLAFAAGAGFIFVGTLLLINYFGAQKAFNLGYYLILFSILFFAILIATRTKR